jgi:hypothetical protein
VSASVSGSAATGPLIREAKSQFTLLYGVVLDGSFGYRIRYEPLLVLVVAAAWFPAAPAAGPAGSSQSPSVPRSRRARSAS